MTELNLNEICQEITREIEGNVDIYPQYLACLVYRQASICAELGLSCLDVPIFVTSQLLKTKPTGIKVARKIIRRLRRVVNKVQEIPIYDDGRTRLSIVLTVKKGSTYMHKVLNIPIDEADLDKCEHVQITNVYKLYAFIKAEFEQDNLLRINVVYLLKKLIELGHRELVEKLVLLTILFLRFKHEPHYHLVHIVKLLKDVLDYIRTFQDVLRDVIKPTMILSSSLISSAIIPVRKVLHKVLGAMFTDDKGTR